LQETSTVAFNTAGHTISELHIDAAVLQESTLNLTTALKIDPEHEKGTVQLPVSLSSGISKIVESWNSQARRPAQVNAEQALVELTCADQGLPGLATHRPPGDPQARPDRGFTG